MHPSQNSPEKSYTEITAKHIPSGCAWPLNCSFYSTKNKHGYYRDRHCIKRLCEKFEELALEIINYEENEMIPLTNEGNESYEEQSVCSICKKEFITDKNDKKAFKLYQKVKGHCHYTGKFRGAAHNICNLKYKIPKEILVVTHNASYDHHFIIKQLAKIFKGQFECLGENTEKYITFSVPIKKEFHKGETTTYKLKFIDSFRFMPTALCILVKYLSDGLHRDKRKDCKSKLSYVSVKGNQLIFQCFACEKNYEKDFNNELIKRFANMYTFCKGDINKFVLLLRKDVYPYEYVDNWKRFEEASLLDKKAFYSELNNKDITDIDYGHYQTVWKGFEIKNLGEYRDLYVQCDTLLLTDVFESFRKKCMEIYELHPVHILSAPGLA